MAIRRLGFYVPRANYLKVMGPLIAHLVTSRSTDVRVAALLPRWNTSKPELWVDADTFSAKWGTRVEVHEMRDARDLHALVRSGSLDAIVTVQPALSDLNAEETSALRAESLKQGTKWVALPEGFSQNGYLTERLASVLEYWDLVCTVGPRSKRFVEARLAEVAPDRARAVLDRTAVVGYPEFDGLTSLPDATEIRRQYALPPDKPVVVVATAPRIVPLSINTWSARGLDARFRDQRGWSKSRLAALTTQVTFPDLLAYRQYLAALRQFADANGALLVGKTRAKHRDPGDVTDCLDCVIEDRAFYPFTTLELMKIASLYFGFYSNTASEAIVSGVYAITALHMPPDAIHTLPEWKRLSEAMTWGETGLWRTEGVSEVIDGASRAGGEALARFAKSTFADYHVDEERRGAVLQDLFAFPCNSSAKIMEALDARWN